MEGLLPLLYRSLKKSQTRRKYECLSSGAAETYNIADFYVKDDLHLLQYSAATPPADARGPRHRRYNSVVVDDRRAGGFDGGGGGRKQKQLVRFRSHRMLSCITGA